MRPQVFSNIQNHKVGQLQEYSIIKRKWYIRGQPQADPGSQAGCVNMARIPCAPPLLHCPFSLGSCLRSAD